MTQQGKMHPKKAELLAVLGEASRISDVALGHLVEVVKHPGEHGWRSSLGAAVIGLPLIGVGAILVDMNEIFVAQSGDADWERAFPDASGGEKA